METKLFPLEEAEAYKKILTNCSHNSKNKEDSRRSGERYSKFIKELSERIGVNQAKISYDNLKSQKKH